MMNEVWKPQYFNFVNEIGKDIFIFKNFFSNDKCNFFTNIAKQIPENKWHGKTTENLNEVEEIRLELQKVFSENYILGQTLFLSRLKNGESHGMHSDNHDFLKVRELNKILKENDPYILVPNNLYGMVVYLNDFKGGELYYNNQDITYKPEKGDLVVHSSEEHCSHQVLTVKSEIRYIHPNFLYQNIKIPFDTNMPL